MQVKYHKIPFETKGWILNLWSKLDHAFAWYSYQIFTSQILLKSCYLVNWPFPNSIFEILSATTLWEPGNQTAVIRKLWIADSQKSSLRHSMIMVSLMEPLLIMATAACCCLIEWLHGGLLKGTHFLAAKHIANASLKLICQGARAGASAGKKKWNHSLLKYCPTAWEQASVWASTIGNFSWKWHWPLNTWRNLCHCNKSSLKLGMRPQTALSVSSVLSQWLDLGM